MIAQEIADMQPIPVFPRGTTTGFKTAYEANRAGAGQYVYPDPMTTVLSQSQLDTLAAQSGVSFIKNGGPAEGRHVGLRIGCAGLSADGKVARVRLLLVYEVKDTRGDAPSSSDTPRYVLLPYGTWEFTAGTMQLSGATDLIADTVAATPGLDDWGTHLEGRDNARDSKLYTPANNQMAMVDVPDLDNAIGIILDSSIGTGVSNPSDTVNPLYCFTT